MLIEFELGEIDFSCISKNNIILQFESDRLFISGFLIPYGLNYKASSLFAFDAPTSSKNLLSVARGMSFNKPIMLEGSPGAGKSSLVVELASVTGNELVRLNLSEQSVYILI